MYLSLKTVEVGKKQNEIVKWDNHLDNKYGKRGTPVREKYEEDFEAFKLGALLQEARKQEI